MNPELTNNLERDDLVIKDVDEVVVEPKSYALLDPNETMDTILAERSGKLAVGLNHCIGQELAVLGMKINSLKQKYVQFHPELTRLNEELESWYKYLSGLKIKLGALGSVDSKIKSRNDLELQLDEFCNEAKKYKDSYRKSIASLPTISEGFNREVQGIDSNLISPTLLTLSMALKGIPDDPISINLVDNVNSFAIDQIMNDRELKLVDSQTYRPSKEILEQFEKLDRNGQQFLKNYGMDISLDQDLSLSETFKRGLVNGGLLGMLKNAAFTQHWSEGKDKKFRSSVSLARNSNGLEVLKAQQPLIGYGAENRERFIENMAPVKIPDDSDYSGWGEFLKRVVFERFDYPYLDGPNRIIKKSDGMEYYEYEMPLIQRI